MDIKITMSEQMAQTIIEFCKAKQEYNKEICKILKGIYNKLDGGVENK